MVAPVQTAERIVFAVDQLPNGLYTTAVVQISYTGQVSDFAWVVPLTAVPDEIEVADPALFDELDRATRPTFVQAGRTVDDDGGFAEPEGGGCGLGAGDSVSSGGGDGEPGGAVSEVTVFGRQRVGPYETVVIGTDDADALGRWLQGNGYEITPQASTLLGSYVGARSTFLAVKLVPGTSADALEPLRFRYRGEPCLPLKLTAISAADVLPVQVFFASQARFVPSDWASLGVDYASEIAIQGDATNYAGVVDRRTSELGGHGFVTEFAGASSAVLRTPSPALLELLVGRPYLTRLLARVPRAALDRDPHFELAPTAPAVSNVHSLPAPPSPDAPKRERRFPSWWPLVGVGLALGLLRRGR